MDSESHPELRQLRERLQKIYEGIAYFQLPTMRYPILDSSLELELNGGNVHTTESGSPHWSQQDNISGLKKLKESLRVDLDVIQRFLDDPSSVHRPPLSTNAPYLISVWNEVACAPPPVVVVFKMFLVELAGVKEKLGNGKKKGGVLQRRPQGGIIRPPGAKVDVVADNGRRWIRVNTIKRSRLVAEFREIDSYLTDSDSDEDEGRGKDSDWDGRPTLAQSEFDNSVLRMGRGLVEAARANRVEGTEEVPEVVMRLTRLEVGRSEGRGEGAGGRGDYDARILKTVKMLEEMGVTVELGEKDEGDVPVPAVPPLSIADGGENEKDGPRPLRPSVRINLDLLMLITLISDLTHAPLPASVEEAQRKFIPPKEYREWKDRMRELQVGVGSLAPTGGKGRNGKGAVGISMEKEDVLKEEENIEVDDLPHDLATHSRALRNQLLQEMSKGQSLLNLV
ncbi:hypothetical protein FA15DRAFT_760155 [Coprinopsis marcescibilis]|uniref:Uncharacterized protein n=1 Tax=Coprinopsis marcescibilis TaxID=230819 RepID=A0A5C3KHL5_COPMA|nr:hypothetical protein FA15DRAFT_760155 [Coprinopsis marcescibilis]